MNPSSDDQAIIITGGAGFIGSNLAASFARDGHRVIVVDAFCRAGVERNWAWLHAQFGDRVTLIRDDIRHPALADRVIGHASAVYHLAAQVAVTESIDDPLHDFDVNVRGTLVWLDAIRRASRAIPFIFASTNKVYGALSDVLLEKEAEGWVPCDRTLRRDGVSEKRALDFHTPYGCSKGAADQYVLDYGRTFGVPTLVFRMSCVYGPRQWGTEDQGWLAHFAASLLQGKAITLYGDGKQIRDVLFIDDAVAAYRAALTFIKACHGQAFNLGGGPTNAISLLTALDRLASLIGTSAHIEFAPWRAGDQRWYVSNTHQARTTLHLPPPQSWGEGLQAMTDWIRNDFANAQHQGLRPCA